MERAGQGYLGNGDQEVHNGSLGKNNRNCVSIDCIRDDWVRMVTAHNIPLDTDALAQRSANTRG